MRRTETDRRERFEAIFDAHHRAVRAYALRRGAGASAEDVVAETFLVAWRRLETVGDDPLPWLLGVARRTLSNENRGDRRRLALRERLREAREPAVAVPGVTMLDGRLADAVTALSSAEREALLLVAWEGLSPHQAARVVGCPAATFRVRLHRARAHVARALAADAQQPTGRPPASIEEIR